MLKKLVGRYSFAELKPRVGDKIHLDLQNPRVRLMGQLVGFITGKSLLVAPQGSGLPTETLKEGSQVSVRMMSGNYISGFQTKVLRRFDRYLGFSVLEYPQTIEVRRIRTHTRVPVSLVGSIDEANEGQGTVEITWPLTVFCTDLSITGVALEAVSSLGKQGDRYYLTLRVDVAGVEQVLLLTMELRTVQPFGSVYQHGFQFIDLDEETHLLLVAYVYQQFLIEAGLMERKDER